MLKLEIPTRKPVDDLRDVTHQFFVERTGLIAKESSESDGLTFTGSDGYVHVEFLEDAEGAPTGVLVTTTEYDYDVREFARMIG